MVEGGSDDGKLNRLSAVVENLSERFYFAEQNRNFTQYSHIYNARLIAMRNSLLEAAKRSWGKADIMPIRVYIQHGHSRHLIEWILAISNRQYMDIKHIDHDLGINDSALLC